MTPSSPSTSTSQDPPELLVAFLEHWIDGYDVVYGVRAKRDGDSLPIRLTAAAFYRVFNTLSSTNMPPNVGDFRLMDRRVVEAILSMEERNRFMKGIFSWVGFPSTGVSFERPERSAGSTGWTMRRRWGLAFDAIASFSSTPLRVWTYVGLGVAAAACIYGMVVLAIALTGGTSNVPGYASLILVTLFLGAMQLISLGIIGEYVARVLTESKQRPLYLLEGIYQADDAGAEPTPNDDVDDPPNGGLAEPLPGSDRRESLASRLRDEPAPEPRRVGTRSRRERTPEWT